MGHARYAPSAIPDLIQQPLLARPLLLHNLPNSLRRQYETAFPRSTWAELHCPRVIRTVGSMVVIPRVTRGEIQDLASRPGFVLSAVVALDPSGETLGNLDHARQARWQHLRIAGEAPWSEDEVTVAVEVDIRTNASLGSTEFLGEGRNDLVLGRVTGCEAAIRLAARVR